MTSRISIVYVCSLLLIKRETETNHCIISHLTFYLTKLFSVFLFYSKKQQQRRTRHLHTTINNSNNRVETLRIKRQQRQTEILTWDSLASVCELK